MANEPSRITDNLLNIFNYSFVETVPYEFFKPRPERDIAVKLVDKEYHCAGCGKVTHVDYQERPLTYFSKGKLKEQRAIYEKLGKRFPTMEEIAEGRPFTNEAIGCCRDCAEKEILHDDAAGQRVCNLALQLHGEDELVVAKARAAMEEALKKWLTGIENADEFLQYGLGDFNAVRDLICAVMLQDTSAEEALLAAYGDTVAAIKGEVTALLASLPDKWQAYAARSTGVYESMNDKMYHEYTVIFPKPGMIPEDYYIYRSIEKSRVRMFLDQPRIESLEELLTEVGFHGEWIDLVNQRLQELVQRA